MLKITLRLYRNEFAAVVGFLPDPRNLSFRQMADLRLEEIVLLDYRFRLTSQQVFTWRQRPNGKRYALTIPLQVARALWSELQVQHLTNELLSVLAILDKELVNSGFTA